LETKRKELHTFAVLRWGAGVITHLDGKVNVAWGVDDVDVAVTPRCVGGS